MAAIDLPVVEVVEDHETYGAPCVVTKTRNSRNKLHSFDGNPAVVVVQTDGQLREQKWYRDGVLARANDLPAVIQWVPDTENHFGADFLKISRWFGPVGPHGTSTMSRNVGPSQIIEANGVVRAEFYSYDGITYGATVCDCNGRIVEGTNVRDAFKQAMFNPDLSY